MSIQTVSESSIPVHVKRVYTRVGIFCALVQVLKGAVADARTGYRKSPGPSGEKAWGVSIKVYFAWDVRRSRPIDIISYSKNGFYGTKSAWKVYEDTADKTEKAIGGIRFFGVLLRQYFGDRRSA